MSKDSKWRRAGQSVRAEGIALTIPMVMISFPLAAAFIGKYLADKFEMPWITFVAIVIGLLAGIRECIQLVKKLNEVQK